MSRQKKRPETEGVRGTKESHSTTRTCPTCAGGGAIVDRRHDLLYEELKDIAAGAQVSESQLSRMLSRNPRTKRGTTLKTAIRVARRMGITLDELAGIVYPEEA